MDKSPCLGCDLKNENKNNRRCMECNARVEYVSGLVGRTHSVHEKKRRGAPCGYPLRGMVRTTQKGTHKGMPQHVGPQKGENKMTILEDKVEEIIKEACNNFGVPVAGLKEGRFHAGYTLARRAIAEKLIANYGMTKVKIGELTGVSNQAIYYLLKKKTTDAVDILHKRYIGDDAERKASLRAERHPSSPSASPRQGKTEPKSEKTVTIDFLERTELLNKLKKYAKEEIRTVEDQVMYFIQDRLYYAEAEAEANGNPG